MEGVGWGMTPRLAVGVELRRLTTHAIDRIEPDLRRYNGRSI